MKKLLSTVSVMSALTLLAACGSQPPGYTNLFGKWGMQFPADRDYKEATAAGSSVSGGAYNEALYKETMENAAYEHDKMQDWRSTIIYSDQAKNVAAGGTYEPFVLSEWQLPADKVDELSSARARLVTALANGSTTSKPDAAARALAKFNCWVEQQRENFQPKDIAYCRDAFLAALEQIETQKSEFPEVVSLNADVFFDFDKSKIRSDALPVLNDVAKMLVEDTSTQVFVWGFTDTAGSAAYNQRLSVRRAQSVAGYLEKQGVTANRLTIQGFGETRLAVPTKDNTPEQANRRVEIRRR
ncbi:OmpA-OmpF porin, OOP family [Arboricoccus pini]|uniref:OmpA-OmpF porin, OOP family n=1 Tax=Arboricoccus pini TaxID=1963835 RepID=A0A212QPZ0_9PROT|nr:OmpA family protein [Arboricoccus pini]SNB61439.1 OmpA-OmpF porin, OOP family [Arboricoccus pini]